MITLQPNRTVDQPALDALGAWLRDNHYSQHCRERIVRHAAAHDELAGAVLSGHLDPEDEEVATAVFIEAMRIVPDDSPAWDVGDVILDAERLADGTHPLPFGPEPPDAPDDRPSWSSHFAGMLARGIAPVSGGSDEAGSFEPSAEDLADYHRWSEDLDRRRAAADRHSPDSLARIHRALYGRTEPFHA